MSSELEEMSARLKTHVRFLASDALQGRETTYNGQKVAAAYLAAQMELLGIAPAYPGSETPYFQSFPLEVTSLDREQSRFKTGSKDGWVYQRDYYLLPLGRRNVQASGPVIFAGYGLHNDDYNDYRKLNIKDHWVVIVDGRPHGQGPLFSQESLAGERLFSKIRYARTKGALGMILLRKGGPDHTRSGVGARRRMRPPDNEEKEVSPLRFPVVVVYETQWPRLFGKFHKRFERGLTRIEREEKPSGFTLRGMKFQLDLKYAKERRWAENVVGILPGTDPRLKDEYVVVSAHYDHVGIIDGQIFNGADDNATGTATLLLLAERLRKKQHKRSLILLWTSGEEQGLLGARHFLKQPPIPLTSMVADINSDMIGRDVEGGVGVIPYQNDDVSSLKTILENVNRQREDGLNLIGTMDHFHRRSDHFPFIEQGIPAIFFLSGVHEDYHGTNDDWDRLDYAHFSKIYRLIEDFTQAVLADQERPVFLRDQDDAGSGG